MYFFYYVPVGIDAERRRFPVLTVCFSFLCFLVFLLNKYFRGAIPLDFTNLIYFPGYSAWEAALTAAFLHFGWVHLIGNLVYLLLFGTYLEDRLGTFLFALVFLGSAFVGNVVQGAYNIHVLGIGSGIIGASGAVSGVLGAFLVRLYRAQVRIAYWVFMPLLAYTRGGRVDVPVVFALALWVLLQVSRSLLQFEGASANVAHMTHLAGFAFGIALVVATGGWRSGRIESHWIKARGYLRRGETFGAQDELSHFVARRPDDGDAHAALARVMVQTGDHVGAMANYMKACELLLRQGRRGRAEDVYQEALRGFPDFTLSPEPHLELAFGLERNLKLDVALTAYELFARRNRRHPEAPFALLRAANLHLRERGEPEEARRCYQALIERYPEDAWVDFAREQVRLLA
jgi:membrane associated rhomboid family serine protease